MPGDAAASCPGQKRAQSGRVQGHCPCLTISSLQHHKQAFRDFFIFFIRACVCGSADDAPTSNLIAGGRRSLLVERCIGERVFPFLVQTDLLPSEAFIMGNKNAA